MSQPSGPAKLAAFLAKTKLSQTEFGRRLGVEQPQVWQWLNDRRPIPGRFALKIEAETGGLVTRHDCRPDLYPRESAA